MTSARALLRDRRLARELIACHAKILGAAGALSDHESPDQVCPLPITYEKMKKWANESRIPQWVLDKAVAAAGD